MGLDFLSRLKSIENSTFMKYKNSIFISRSSSHKSEKWNNITIFIDFSSLIIEFN